MGDDLRRIFVSSALLMLVAGSLSARDREREKLCRSYADAAVSEWRRSEEAGCGFSSGRWHDGWDRHYNWCLTTAERNLGIEADIRRRDLSKCLEAPDPAPSGGLVGVVAQQVGAALELELEGLRGGSSLALEAAESLTFNWSIADASVEEAIWQVLSFPLEPSDLTLRPASLLALGRSPGTSGDKGVEGSFELAPFAYFDYQGAPRKSEVERLDFEKTIHLATVMQFKTPSSGSTRSGSRSSSTGRKPTARSKKAPKQLSRVGLDVLNRQVPPEPDGRQRIFVRVLARKSDGGWTKVASRAFKVTLPKKGADAYRPYRLVDLGLDAGQEANKRMEDCVRVVGFVPPAKGQEWRLPWALGAFPATGTYCKNPHFPPQQPSECEWWECVGEFVIEDVVGTLADAYDALKTAVDDLKDAVTTLASMYNPFCLQAGLVSNDAEAVCEKILKVGSAVALDACLAANGIPPTLPSSTDLLNAAKGDLSEIAVGLLEQAGVPCDDLTLTKEEAWAAKQGSSALGASVSVDTSNGVDVCRDLMGAAINEIHDELRQSVSEQVASVARIPYFPEVVMIPEPTARSGTALVAFRLESTGVPIDPQQECTATVQVHGKPLYVKKGENQTAEPFRAKTLSIPALILPHWMQSSVPVGSRAFSVVLDEPKDTHFQGRPDWLRSRKERGLFTPSGHEFMLLAGNRLQASVASDCIQRVRQPGKGSDTVEQPAPRIVSRSTLRAVGDTPEWLPEFYNQLCQARTRSIDVLGIKVNAPPEREPYCQWIEGYLAGG